YEKGQTVSLLRRFFAWGVDWLVIGFVQGLLVFGLNFIPAYKNWATNYPIFSDRMWFFIMVFAVFIVMMKLTNGQTLGKKVVRIRVVETGHEKIR
ncbi:RDD family protein, partial [Enterococcus faecium]|uniref:RDD family protein n=2 Tax=Enterococcus TaxID=1350 RepID=UPI0039FC665D